MCRYVIFVLLAAALSHAQDPGHSSARFAGCYQVTSLTWSPDGSDIRLIPKEFELLNDSRGNGAFRMRGLPIAEKNSIERAWWWMPKSANKVRIDWSSGLGGIHGTLKRSKTGGLAGKIKEWCDSRCGWKKRTGRIRVEPIACTP
jgi:hypothetical protein